MINIHVKIFFIVPFTCLLGESSKVLFNSFLAHLILSLSPANKYLACQPNVLCVAYRWLDLNSMLLVQFDRSNIKGIFVCCCRFGHWAHL